MEVNIYTASSIKGMRAGDGTVGYILELVKTGEPYTKCEVVPVQHLTANQAQMQALIEALQQLKNHSRNYIQVHNPLLVKFHQNKILLKQLCPYLLLP